MSVKTVTVVTFYIPEESGQLERFLETNGGKGWEESYRSENYVEYTREDEYMTLPPRIE